MVKKIKIQNFKKFEDVEVTLNHVAKVIGPNGMGKTSFIQALKWVLLGEFDSSYVRDSSKKTTVEVEFSDGTLVTRSYEGEKQSLAINGKPYTVTKTVNEICLQKLGCSSEVASAMFDVNDFEEYSKSPKSFCEFILAFVPVKISKEGFSKFLIEANGGEFGEAEKAFLDSALDKSVYHISDLDELYKRFYEERRVKNREVKEFKPKAEFDLSALPTGKKNDITNRLQEILSFEKDAAAYQQRQADYAKAVTAQETVLSRKKQLEEELKKFDSIMAFDKSAVELRAEIKTLREEKDGKFREKAGLDSEFNTLKNQYYGFQTGNCPLMGNQPCAAEPSVRNNILNGINVRAGQVLQRTNALQAEISKLEKRIEEMEAKVDLALKMEKDLTRKEAILAELSHLVIPDIPEKPQEVPVGNLTEEKARIMKDLAIYEQFETAKKYQAEYEAAEKHAKMLDMAVKLFDPGKGVKAVVLKNVLKPLEAVVNKNGYSVTLLDNGEFSPSVQLNGVKVPMKNLSSGEFIMVVYQFMRAIHEITGVKFLILDNIDKLDKENTKLLVDIIEKDTVFENIIICGVNHEDNVVGNIVF